jgi:hypothetical protein
MTERQERQRMLRIAQERLRGWCGGSPHAQSFALDRTVAYQRNTNTVLLFCVGCANEAPTVRLYLAYIYEGPF